MLKLDLESLSQKGSGEAPLYLAQKIVGKNEAAKRPHSPLGVAEPDGVDVTAYLGSPANGVEENKASSPANIDEAALQQEGADLTLVTKTEEKMTGGAWWMQIIRAYQTASTLTEEERQLLEGHVNAHICFYSLNSSAGLKFLRSMPSSILVLELRGCHLDSRSLAEGLFFSQCFSVQSMCLADNQLTSIPFFLDKMKDLTFLDLSHNRLAHTPASADAHAAASLNSAMPTSLVDALKMQEDAALGNSVDGGDFFKALGTLRVLDSLVYLNLEGNKKLCSVYYYRDMVITALPKLVGLDSHIICDEELYGAVHGQFLMFPPPFCAGHKQFRVPKSFREVGPDFDADMGEQEQAIAATTSVKRKAGMRRAGNLISVPVFNTDKARRLAEVRKFINVKSSMLLQQYRMTSPVIRIQRCIRTWLTWVRGRPMRVYANLASLQARVRRFLFLRRCKKDLKRTLQAAGEWIEALDGEQEELPSPVPAAKAVPGEHLVVPAAVNRREHERSQYRLHVHAMTITTFMRTVVSKLCRARARAVLSRWGRTTVRGWRRDLRFLLVKDVHGLVVPQESANMVLDVVAHFEENYCRRHRQHLVQDNPLLPPTLQPLVEFEYSAESLSEVHYLTVRKGAKEVRTVHVKLHSKGLQPTELSAVSRRCFHPVGPGSAAASSSSSDHDHQLADRLAAHRHGVWRVYTQAPVEVRKQLRVLKRRGARVNMHALRAQLPVTTRKLQSHVQKATEDYPSAVPQRLALISVPTDRMVVLRDAVRYLRNPRNYYYASVAARGLWFDADVEEEMSAIRIQALVRGVSWRRLNATRVMDKLVMRRASICVQRWWRHGNCLKRRLRMLSQVGTVCASITEPVFYLDLWSFYWALRQRHLPYVSSGLELFPEMRGTPHVTSGGKGVMKGLRDDVVNCPQYSERAAKDEQAVQGMSSPYKIPSPRVEEKDAADQRPAAAWQKEQRQPRNVNIVQRTRFGIPLWLPSRPHSEEFYQGRRTDGHHKSRQEYNSEYSLYAQRRDLPFPLYDLVSKGVAVAVRPLKVPLEKSRGGLEPGSRRYYREGLIHASSDAEADIRVVELRFPSLQEARSRAMLLILCTYDYRSHTSITPMPEGLVKDRMYARRVDISRAKEQMVADLESTGGNASASAVVNNNNSKSTTTKKDATTMAAHAVVAPIEKELLLQPGLPAGWISRMGYTVWDVMRFRFLCHSLVVVSNSNMAPDERRIVQEPTLPPSGPRNDFTRVRANELLDQRMEHSLLSYSDSVYSNGGYDDDDAETRNEDDRTSGQLHQQQQDGIVPMEGSLEGSLGSLDGVPLPAELYSEMVSMLDVSLSAGGHIDDEDNDVEGEKEEEEVQDEEEGQDQVVEGVLSQQQKKRKQQQKRVGGRRRSSGKGGVSTSNKLFSPHQRPSSFLSSGVGLTTGHEWSPRSAHAENLLSENSAERRALAAIGSDGGVPLSSLPSVPIDASMDGFESDVSGLVSEQQDGVAGLRSRPERLYESHRASSPPSNHQLRQLGNAHATAAGTNAGAAVLPLPGQTSTHLLATTATAGGGHGANTATVHSRAAADMHVRWQTTAAMQYLKSSVWDADKVMLWCSRGFDNGGSSNTAEGGGRSSRDSLADFNNVATTRGEGAASRPSRYLIPVRPNKGHDHERGVNEQRAMVARLEALQLGLYEYAMRLSRLEKVNDATLGAVMGGNNSTGGGYSNVNDPNSAAALAHVATLHRNYYSGTTGTTDALTGSALHQNPTQLDGAVQPPHPEFPYPPSASTQPIATNNLTGIVATKPDSPMQVEYSAVDDSVSFTVYRSPRGKPSSSSSSAPAHISVVGPPLAGTTIFESEIETDAALPLSVVASSPVRLSEVNKCQPVSATLAQSSQAQEVRELELLQQQQVVGGGSTTLSGDGGAIVRPPRNSRKSASLHHHRHHYETDPTAAAAEDNKEAKIRVEAARAGQKVSQKHRKRFLRRAIVVKSHIKHLERGDLSAVRRYQQDMHARSHRPNSAISEDWGRPGRTGYAVGSAYAQLVHVADDAAPGLQQPSGESSRMHAAGDAVGGGPVITTTAATATGGGGHTSRTRHSQNASSPGGTRASSLPVYPYQQQQSNKYGGGTSNTSYLPDSMSHSIDNLSAGSVEELLGLGKRLSFDPNYADLLNPRQMDNNNPYNNLSPRSGGNRYGGGSPRSQVSWSSTTNQQQQDQSQPQVRPGSGALRKQQWQQSTGKGESFISTLLASATIGSGDNNRTATANNNSTSGSSSSRPKGAALHRTVSAFSNASAQSSSNDAVRASRAVSAVTEEVRSVVSGGTARLNLEHHIDLTLGNMAAIPLPSPIATDTTAAAAAANRKKSGLKKSSSGTKTADKRVGSAGRNGKGRGGRGLGGKKAAVAAALRTDDSVDTMDLDVDGLVPRYAPQRVPAHFVAPVQAEPFLPDLFCKR